MILIINLGSDKSKYIKKVVDEAGFENKIINLKDISSIDYKKFSGIIISGYPFKLEPLLENFKFIKNISIPLMGICGGHQLIGMIFGSKIFKGKTIERKQVIEIIKDSEIFKNLDKKSVFAHDHRYGITLPDDFHLLAKSEDYEVEAMKHKNKNIYGVQFHPEISGEPGKRILINFCNICESRTPSLFSTQVKN